MRAWWNWQTHQLEGLVRQKYGGWRFKPLATADLYMVYVLRSEKDGTRYTGYTSDLKKRLRQHNAGDSRYTRKKLPWRLIYQEKIESLLEARKREKFLKSGRGRDFLDQIMVKMLKRASVVELADTPA